MSFIQEGKVHLRENDFGVQDTMSHGLVLLKTWLRPSWNLSHNQFTLLFKFVQCQNSTQAKPSIGSTRKKCNILFIVSKEKPIDALKMFKCFIVWPSSLLQIFQFMWP